MSNRSYISRRKFLAMSSVSPIIAAGCANITTVDNAGTLSTSTSARHFSPLKATSDRIIRKVAGLRPFRPSGFVVKTERFDETTVIHNYGHGGAGVTLSWGSAALAVEQALQTDGTDFAVLGCGAVGLATARLLQRKGYKATIYAKDLPPNTTSNIAGAMWFPTSVYRSGQITAAFEEQYIKASRISHQVFQTYVGDEYGVYWLPMHFLYNQPTQTEFPGGEDIYPGRKVIEDPQTYFGFPYTQQVYSMMIDPMVYLNAIVRDFYRAGGEIVTRTFDTIADVTALPHSAVINCTGLGAGTLFNDKEIVPVKGQLNILLPQPEIDYAYITFTSAGSLYMFPRVNEIVLGGTSEQGNYSLEPDPVQVERIINGHAAIAARLKV